MGDKRRNPAREAQAFAPATVANVAVGFDMLGFALDGVGDRVSVARDPDNRGVAVDAIGGVVPDLPTDPARNTASVALAALIDDLRPAHGFRIRLDKGIPLGSGMGGSAASAVGAVVAAAALLDTPPPRERLLAWALEGERAASGAAHADNAAPCLWGGLVAAVSSDPVEIVSIPIPRGLHYVLVHPHLAIETRSARAVLPRELPLSTHVEQSMRLAGFLAGCFRNDAALVGRSLVDRVAEPSRAALIPGYAAAREGALHAGALGAGIAGSGPSVFAWVLDAATAVRVERAMRAAFSAEGIESDGFSGALGAAGARVVA